MKPKTKAIVTTTALLVGLGMLILAGQDLVSDSIPRGGGIFLLGLLLYVSALFHIRDVQIRELQAKVDLLEAKGLGD